MASKTKMSKEDAARERSGLPHVGFTPSKARDKLPVDWSLTDHELLCGQLKAWKTAAWIKNAANQVGIKVARTGDIELVINQLAIKMIAQQVLELTAKVAANNNNNNNIDEEKDNDDENEDEDEDDQYQPKRVMVKNHQGKQVMKIMNKNTGKGGIKKKRRLNKNKDKMNNNNNNKNTSIGYNVCITLDIDN
jgi:hypothetical protein